MSTQRARQNTRHSRRPMPGCQDSTRLLEKRTSTVHECRTSAGIPHRCICDRPPGDCPRAASLLGGRRSALRARSRAGIKRTGRRPGCFSRDCLRRAACAYAAACARTRCRPAGLPRQRCAVEHPAPRHPTPCTHVRRCSTTTYARSTPCCVCSKGKRVARCFPAHGVRRPASQAS